MSIQASRLSRIQAAGLHLYQLEPVLGRILGRASIGVEKRSLHCRLPHIWPLALRKNSVFEV